MQEMAEPTEGLSKHSTVLAELEDIGSTVPFAVGTILYVKTEFMSNNEQEELLKVGTCGQVQEVDSYTDSKGIDRADHLINFQGHAFSQWVFSYNLSKLEVR